MLKYRTEEIEKLKNNEIVKSKKTKIEKWKVEK